MITRPLDLNSKLRPPPRRYDWVFYVNITVIVMFFSFFGSRFVLSPALVINDEDFHAPVRPASQVAYVPGTVVVSIKANRQIFVDSGLVSQSQFRAWLIDKAKTTPAPSLLVRADAGVPVEEILWISEVATNAGFKLVSIPVQPDQTGRAGDGTEGARRQER